LNGLDELREVEGGGVSKELLETLEVFGGFNVVGK
jgi:hypothetical protein